MLIASAVSAGPADRPVPQLEMPRNSNRLARAQDGCQDCDRTGRSKHQRPRGVGLGVDITSRKQNPHSLPLASSRLAPGSRHMPADTNSYFFSYDLLRLSRSSVSKHLVAVSVFVHRLAGWHTSQLIWRWSLWRFGSSVDCITVRQSPRYKCAYNWL